MELEHCINFLLTRAQNTVLQYFKSRLREYNVTPGQYAVLQCLWQNSEASPSVIAQTLVLDGSTVTGLLDRLEEKGFLKRNMNKEDRRALQIELTEQGRAIQQDILARIEQANVEVLRSFTHEEQEQFKTYLTRICRLD